MPAPRSWPGFGENSRVLKGALQRVEGAADAVQTSIGGVCSLESLDLGGVESDEESMLAALNIDLTDWATETQSIDQWYATIGADRLPDDLRHELTELKDRLRAAVRATSRGSEDIGRSR